MSPALVNTVVVIVVVVIAVVVFKAISQCFFSVMFLFVSCYFLTTGTQPNKRFIPTLIATRTDVFLANPPTLKMPHAERSNEIR